MWEGQGKTNGFASVSQQERRRRPDDEPDGPRVQGRSGEEFNPNPSHGDVEPERGAGVFGPRLHRLEIVTGLDGLIGHEVAFSPQLPARILR